MPVWYFVHFFRIQVFFFAKKPGKRVSILSHILAIETGGTKLQMAVGTKTGEILYNHRMTVVPERGSKGILEAVLAAAPAVYEKAEALGGSIEAVGLGFGGPIDSRNGSALASEQIDGWKDFPIRAYLQERLGKKTFVYNDANAATWGEYCKGSGQGSEIFFYSNIGSGIGGGVVIDGKLYDGQGVGAAELGQTYTYDDNGQPPFPFLQVERLCSGWAIDNKLHTAQIPPDSLLWQLGGGSQQALNCRLLGQAVNEGDAFSTAFLDERMHVFSVALANVITLFSPQCIAIGGGVSLIGEPLLEMIRRHVAQYVSKTGASRYRIVKSELDEDVVLVGSLLLAARDAGL